MKGFPNQIADLGKLAAGMQCLVQLTDQGDDAKDDGIFGQALVHAGVVGTGHTPIPVADYIRQQLKKTLSNQSFRTTARGLRELYRILGLIDDSGAQVDVTISGRRIATFAGLPLDVEQIEFWRKVILDITHDGGDGESSHPYQVLLSLVARNPGITRAKCALALEARNDSRAELDRIVDLAKLSEDTIRARSVLQNRTGITLRRCFRSLRNNLETFVRRGRQAYVLADVPGQADASILVPTQDQRAPRTSRKVTPDSIARAGTVENFDEVVTTTSPKSIRIRQKRLLRHQLIVKKLAGRLSDAGATLYEDPFDILALIDARRLLVEVKTLDGTNPDERERVREALSQLLYYKAFIPPTSETVINIACFEGPISEAHHQWLNNYEIAVIWLSNSRFVGDALAFTALGTYMEELC